MSEIPNQNPDARGSGTIESTAAPAGEAPGGGARPHPGALLETRCASHSIAGRRAANQDCALALEVRLPGTQYALAVVADGMGGHAGGEHAAEIATTTVVKSLAASMVAALQGQLLQVERAIRRAFLAANQNIQREARLHPERRDMGTTLTTALIAGYELFVASVGDSRVYLWQDGEFKRLTQDDSVIIRMLNVGKITESQARLHPLDNQILHALGCGETLASLRITRHRLLPGDVVAVTSDGFWKWADLDAPRLFLALDAGPGALEDLAVSLVEEAYRAGSDDNITVALLWHNGGNHATQERVCNQEGDDHGR